jgi:hypothetical protein
MERGLDMPRILQTIAERASAGKGLESFEWGESGDRKRKMKK